MADEKPTERTPKGFEVPVPKRNEFFGNLKKASKPDGDSASTPAVGEKPVQQAEHKAD
jgi:hypothetical protein